MNNYNKLRQAISALNNSAETKDNLYRQLFRAEVNGEKFNVDAIIRRLEHVANNIDRKREYSMQVDKILNVSDYLEVHKYAPELNKLHLTNGSTISTPGEFTIQGAAEYVAKSIVNSKISRI